MMDFDNLKQVWKAGQNYQQAPAYSQDDIQAFRRSRSRDFTKWIRSSLRMDIVVKTLIATALIVLVFLFDTSWIVPLVLIALAALCVLLVLVEMPYMQRSIRLDEATDSMQQTLVDRITFLKTFYFRIQFFIGLSNPLLVCTGAFYYYYLKYQDIVFADLEDVLVFAAILIISFLFTIPTTASMYGFHLRGLQNALANLDDTDHWQKEIRRHQKSKKVMSWVFGALLVVGIIALLVVIFL